VSGNSNLEALVAAAGGAQSAAATELLRREADPHEVLAQLSKSINVDVRGWVVVAAREVLGANAISLLIAMLDDRDPDIRVMAMSSIEDADPTAIAPFANRLRRRLRSSNPYEVLATSWTLARLGDRDSVHLVKDYRDGFDDWQWQHKAADVVLQYMTNPDEVIRGVRDHDHERMTWLVYAAALIRTPAAIEALRECSTGAPDPACQGKCAYSVEHYVRRS
jgi:HEAT repeat protein